MEISGFENHCIRDRRQSPLPELVATSSQSIDFDARQNMASIVCRADLFICICGAYFFGTGCSGHPK